MKWQDRVNFAHRDPTGFKHRLARFFGRDAHEQAPLPAKHELGTPRDPYDRDGRRRRNRAHSRARAVTRSRGQLMRS